MTTTTNGRSGLTEFVLGAAATSSACLFTNPIEVIKTRMQVQGELSRGATIYRRPWQAGLAMVRAEGVSSLFKGLAPALGYQVAMNGVRLGMYGSLKSALEPSSSSSDAVRFGTSLLAGAISGAAGSCLGSPMYLIKVRLQISSNAAVHVGQQHSGHNNMRSAIRSIVREEGIPGLWRGSHAQMLRVIVGSAVQLSVYDHCKMLLQRHWMDGGDNNNSSAVHIASGLLASLFVTVAMNPFDVVSTRLMNQSVGRDAAQLAYTGIVDCLKKTTAAEGAFGLFKGLPAHYLRQGPHTVLTFLFWEQYKAIAAQYGL